MDQKTQPKPQPQQTATANMDQPQQTATAKQTSRRGQTKCIVIYDDPGYLKSAKAK